MYKFLLLVPLLLAGCASEVTLEGQGEQLKTLGEYHTAQRKVEVAKQAVETGTSNLANAQAALLQAEEVLKEAKQKLDSML